MSKWVVFNGFLQQLPPQEQASLLHTLSAEEQQSLLNLSLSFPSPIQPPSPIESTLKRIHFSWLTAIIRSFSEKDAHLFISVLDKERQKLVAEELKLSFHSIVCSPLASHFFQTTLLKKLSSNLSDFLPQEWLPSSSLTPLISLPFSSLNTLLFFLGLHDLCLELKYIIDTKKLKKVYSCLSEDQQNYIRQLMQTKEPIRFMRMDLTNWHGDKESLNSLIMHRGMNRLAKACIEQHPAFVWHLIHKMSVEQALSFQKLFSPTENPMAQSILISQIVELLSFMRHSR